MPSVGIIETLMGLIDQPDAQIQVDQNEIIELLEADNQTIDIQEAITVATEMQDYKTVNISSQLRKDPFTIQWVLAPHFPTDDSDPDREGLLDNSFRVY